MSERRHFIQTLAAAGLSPALAAAAAPQAALQSAAKPQIHARRLRPGDTVALVSPANATFEREPIEIATEALQALGFKVRHGANLRARYGQFGGTDAQRAADINAMFADDSVAGIIAMTGGSGCNRIVDKLDYKTIAARPKFFGGFSDLTSLVNGIQRQTGLVTFHCPVASSEWNGYSVAAFRSLVMEGEAALLKNPPPERGDNIVPTQYRTRALRGGKARGRLVGGNLAVLSSLIGTPYAPEFRGAILFLEEINEYIYRVDRMLSTLRLAGALDQLAGVVLGHFTKCEPGDGNYGVLTLDEVFDDYFLPLNVPVYRGAQFGHVKRKLTIPVGAEAEMDADAGTIQLLKPVTV
ncbi:LD-carboxypeptidase [Pelomonas sp. SE-A7]|uniref:S66 peptidase family protein n=1 Tax=Pelomonas sp. SE-A7 TaxID=3054953 RepID=UPI00259CB1CA|nr:LD-carboxypeptidase [Pelomonas sp. SE-A7]MDM4768146.1 LD-carboxypeptidase [Pelomonas sp. SE-A7]